MNSGEGKNRTHLNARALANEPGHNPVVFLLPRMCSLDDTTVTINMRITQMQRCLRTLPDHLWVTKTILVYRLQGFLHLKNKCFCV